MRRKLKIIGLVFAILVIVALVVGEIMGRAEQTPYTVEKQLGEVEVRCYPALVVAQVHVTGVRRDAVRDGFRLLADYIFGNNTKQQKIDMTAPVVQQASEKIPMTAPVLQQGAQQDWQVRFVMPANDTLDTLPKPNNSLVQLKQLPPRRFAVLRFSGLARDAVLKAKTNALQAVLQQHGMATVGKPIYAFYNPPWTLPPMRRNEVLFELAVAADEGS